MSKRWARRSDSFEWCVSTEGLIRARQSWPGDPAISAHVKLILWAACDIGLGRIAIESKSKYVVRHVLNDAHST